MGSLSLSVHPLFFAFGFYYALTGRIFVFVIYTVTAVIHELGHSFVASNAGYRLDKITLMPFGAVVSGEIEGLKLADEIKVALAGPFINLAVGILFVAFWWICPESYAFTDVVAEANFSMAIVNFIPAFPLDGGRVLSAVLGLKIGKKRADLVCRIVGVVFVSLLLLAFFITLNRTVNVSLLLFALFVLFGLFGKARENKYVKLCVGSTENLKRGMPVVKQALDKNASVKKMLSILNVDAINEIAVYDGDEQVAVLTQKRIKEITEKAELYQPVARYL